MKKKLKFEIGSLVRVKREIPFSWGYGTGVSGSAPSPPMMWSNIFNTEENAIVIGKEEFFEEVVAITPWSSGSIPIDEKRKLVKKTPVYGCKSNKKYYVRFADIKKIKHQ